VGYLKLLINDYPSIMGKMPHTDWKRWEIKCPEWMREEIEDTFERFLEEKWRDTPNITAAEPAS
jgi:hypothetical protein